MPASAISDPRQLKEYIGREMGVSDWLEMTQARINTFADATGDRQWIHLDVERAKKESPFGAPIAHGFLTLSLASKFLSEVLPSRGGMKMSVNYGLNRVRFMAPLRVGSKVRAHFAVQSLKETPQFLEVVFAVTFEEMGSDKPISVVEWVIRFYF